MNKIIILVGMATSSLFSASYESVAKAQLEQESKLLEYEAHQRIFAIFATKSTKHQYYYNMKKSKELKNIKGLYTFGD